MKTKITLLFALISFLGMGQYAKTLFETLSPELTDQNFLKTTNSIFGINIPTGALVVRFADSAGTNVQWFKTDFNQNETFYSANLPSAFIRPNENIIGLVEENNFQYIITNDSASVGQFNGIRIYKYENYTNLVDEFEYPVYIERYAMNFYHRYNQFYFFIGTKNKTLRVLKVEPATLSVLQNEQVYPMPGDQPSFAIGQIHTYFINETNYDVFSTLQFELNKNSLARFQVRNNVVDTKDTLTIPFLKNVIGINQEQQKLVCQIPYTNHDVVFYQLDTAQQLADFNQISSYIIDSISPNVIKNFKYIGNDTRDVFINYVSKKNSIIEIENGIVKYNSNTNTRIIVKNCTLHNDKLFVVGLRDILNFYVDINHNKFALFIDFNSLNKLKNFREYNTKFNFGPMEVKTGIGEIIFPYLPQYHDTVHFSNLILWTQQLISFKKSNITSQDSTYQILLSHNKPGPVTLDSYYDQNTVSTYNKNFYIDQYMVASHVANSTNPLYSIPREILEWPANGDVSKGQAAQLAPFIDLNNNQLYEPELGEYPSFPGTQCLLNITHLDEPDVQIEVHNYMYRFDCEDTLKEVIFTCSEIYNRTSQVIDSLSVGYLSDIANGYNYDNYAETHVDLGLIFTHNGDSFDEANTFTPGYGELLPTIGQQFLKGNQVTPNNQDQESGINQNQTVNGFGFDDGIIDNEYFGLEYSFIMNLFSSNDMIRVPHSMIDFFHTLNGRWVDGSNQYFGGMGHQNYLNSSGIKSKYMFPANSDPLNYGTSGQTPSNIWSEISENNPVGLRYTLGSFGATNLAGNSSVAYHTAFFGGDRVPGIEQSKDKLFRKALFVKNHFNQNQTPCGQTFDNLSPEMVTSVAEIKQELGVLIYPNPFTDQLTIQLEKESESRLQLFDLQGKKVLDKSLSVGEKTISVRDLEKGIYLLSIETEFGKTTRKVVKI